MAAQRHVNVLNLRDVICLYIRRYYGTYLDILRSTVQCYASNAYTVSHCHLSNIAQTGIKFGYLMSDYFYEEAGLMLPKKRLKLGALHQTVDDDDTVSRQQMSQLNWRSGAAAISTVSTCHSHPLYATPYGTSSK